MLRKDFFVWKGEEPDTYIVSSRQCFTEDHHLWSVIYDDRRSFPSLWLTIVTPRSYFLVDTLSGVPLHNTRQALVRIPIAGEELDHSVGHIPQRQTYRSRTDLSSI